jgi:hypothetical protein
MIRASSVPFYKAHDLYKYDHKNVIYCAFVGVHNNEPLYKYGKSTKLFEREYKAHRHNFPVFQMQFVKLTDNKDIVEDILERELQIRDIHRSATINAKRQTELFTVNETYDIEYVHDLLVRIIKDNPSYEVKLLRQRIIRLQQQIKEMS